MKFSSSANEFHKKTQGLSAFLAALVGLAVFKEELNLLKVTIFSWEISVLQIIVPLILALLLSSYLATLSYYEDTPRKYPVKGYLRFVSEFLGILSLLYPITVGTVLAISWVLSKFETGIPPAFLEVASALAALIVSLMTSKRITSLKNQEVDEEIISSSFDDLLPKLSAKNKQEDINWTGFLSSYEAMRAQLKRFLNISGYGAAGENLFDMAVVLRGQGLMDAQDVKLAKEIVDMRNQIAHARDIPASEVSSMIMKFNKMSARVRKVFLEYHTKNT